MAGAVLLDLYNTLVPGGDAGRAAMVRDMAAELGVDPEEFGRLVVRSWPDRMHGVYGDLEAETAALAGRLGAAPSPERVSRAAARRMEFGRTQLVAPEETMSALDRLRADGRRLAIVSNCTFDSADALRRTPLATAVDALVLSCEAHLGKPDPRIYRAALSALGADPAAAIYVGDGADRELSGAAALGMRVIQTTEYTESDRSWRGERIGSITELPERLGASHPLHGSAITGRRE